MLLRGGGKNNNVGEGNGNDIVLPKYVLGNLNEGISSPSIPSESSHNEGGAPVIFPGSSVFKVFEIDYDGKLIKMSEEDFNNLSEEERINFIQYDQNYTTNPIDSDPAKMWNASPTYLYTKEQMDIINENSIVQLYNGTITKFDDNIVMDILDALNSMEVSSDNIQKGQYYCIILKKMYDAITNPEPLGE